MPASTQPAAGSETGAPPLTHQTWSDFALPPLRLKAPLGWHPMVSEWTAQSAKVRWESLTVTEHRSLAHDASRPTHDDVRERSLATSRSSFCCVGCGTAGEKCSYSY